MKTLLKRLCILCLAIVCFVFPMNACGDKGDSRSTIVIGAGEVREFGKSNDAYTDGALFLKVDDENIAKVEGVELYAPSVSDARTIYRLRGVTAGETSLSIYSPDGKNLIESYKLVVKNEETVRVGDGDLVYSISVDKTTAEIYKDDTMVTYTVVTSADVDELKFTQLGHHYQKYFFDELISTVESDNAESFIFYLDDLTIKDDSLSNVIVSDTLGVRYSASKAINGDKATWTVKWDLGHTAVRFIQISALDTETEKKQDNYVKLNFTYPVVGNNNPLAQAVELFVKYNLTQPLLFKMEDGASEIALEDKNAFRGTSTDFASRFTDTVMYGGNSVQNLTTYDMARTYTTSNFITNYGVGLFGGKKVLCDYGALYGDTLGFYYPITDELRAVIAYKNGYEIDAEKFPYAHGILEKGSAVMEEIIVDGMTDFEKEKAIYTWMFNNYYDGLETPTASEDTVEGYAIIKTAYGLLNNYSGDCMAWSGTFYTLCNMAGLDCVTVDVATGSGGGVGYTQANHRINMIKLGDEYYFVESFWSWQKDEPSDGDYRYMNMTTEKAQTLYTWKPESNGGPFVCDDSSYLVDEHTGDLLP